MLPNDFRESFAPRGWYVRRTGDAPLKRFQVLGERASATNLVRKVIEKNTGLARVDALGWKHAIPHMAAVPSDMLVICAVRDAAAWALSMHKRPWHAHRDLQALEFADFIRAPWHGIVDRVSDFEEIPAAFRPDVANAELQHDRHPITGEPFRNLFHLRRVKLAALLGMLNRDCNVLVVRAELVQDDQIAFAAWMIEHFGLALKGQMIKPVTQRLGTRFRRRVAVDTPRTLGAEDRAFLRAEIDLETEAALGYDYSLD